MLNRSNLKASQRIEFVVFIGPDHGVPTGQNVCFRAATRAAAHRIVLSIGGTGLSKSSTIFIVFKSFVKALFIFTIFYRIKALYVTPSRTTFGFIRDFIVFLPLFFVSKKRIAHWHGADISSFLERSPSVISALYRWIYNQFEIHIVLTESMAEQLKYFRVKSLKVIPNFCSVQSVAAKKQNTESRIQLLFLSNLMLEKGIADFLDVIQRLADTNRYNQHIEIHIAGAFADFDKNAFYNRIDSIETCLPIYYHGIVKGLSKQKLLEDSDVLIFPSYYRTEAYPLVVIEAMATGNCVLAYRHNYMENILPSNCGILVNKRDRASLFENLVNLLENKNLLHRYQKAAFNYSKKFTRKKFIDSIQNIIYNDSKI